MTALIWQTALLLLGAYFLGAFAGCVIRRTFFAVLPAQPVGPQSAVEPTPPRRLPDPLPIAVPTGALETPGGISQMPAAERFGRALSGEAPAAGPAASFSPGRTAGPAGVDSSRPPAAAPPARPAPAATVPWAPAVSTAAARSTADGSHARAPEQEPPQPPSADRPLARPAASSRSVGTSAAAAAALAAAAARHQAAQAASRPDRGAVPVAPGSAASPRSAASAPAGTAAPADDLTRIRGIDSDLASRLKALGITRFAEIAAWQKADVRRIGEALGFRGRIEQENWIEQAQMLMSGSETAFARRQRLTSQPLARPSPDQGEQRPRDQRPRLDMVASGLGAAVAASVAAAPRRSALALGRDNLQRISLINEEVERLLNVQGISRYHQIAQWISSDVSRFERLVGGEGRISRENWIEQAAILARGGTTAYALEIDEQQAAIAAARPRPTQLAEAIRTAQQGTPRKVDLTSLRSVRSAAFRSGDADPSGTAATASQVAGRADDLKRIRGVGVLIEKRLNGMGYRTYEQVANWTAADVDRVSQALEFQGRIERENWVEQARILASGGQTEFARRVDRGEVETSRNRR